LQRERSEVEATLQMQAAALAGDIARKLLQRLPAASWNRHFVVGACSELSRLSPAEQALLRQPDQEHVVQVISADKLSDDDQALLHKALNTALRDASERGESSKFALEFAVDPPLLAGIELHFRHLTIRNHWAADIAQILQRVQHDGDPAKIA
jgi:F-type H+-transporting ATPase subunit b